MKSLQHVILQELDKYADLQINLGSESARLDISQHLARTVTAEFEKSLENDSCYGVLRTMKGTDRTLKPPGFGQC